MTAHFTRLLKGMSLWAVYKTMSPFFPQEPLGVDQGEMFPFFSVAASPRMLFSEGEGARLQRKKMLKERSPPRSHNIPYLERRF